MTRMTIKATNCTAEQLEESLISESGYRCRVEQTGAGEFVLETFHHYLTVRDHMYPALDRNRAVESYRTDGA